jgi:hypothetical protein
MRKHLPPIVALRHADPEDRSILGSGAFCVRSAITNAVAKLAQVVASFGRYFFD